MLFKTSIFRRVRKRLEFSNFNMKRTVKLPLQTDSTGNVIYKIGAFYSLKIRGFYSQIVIHQEI